MSSKAIDLSGDRAGAFRVVVLAYAIALGVGVATGAALAGAHPIAVAAAADAAATVAVFLFSVAFRNSSLYDPYWSVAPIPIALYWCFAGAGDPLRQAVVVALVALWGARLTGNWARRWRGLDDEDWRYRDLQRKSGRAYWLVSFSGIHCFPTLMVFLGCLPLFPALAASSRPFGALDVAAALATAAAIALEARADQELWRFLRAGPAPGEILRSGLWARSRHPNYLGEILFWWGLALFGLAAAPAWWWTAVGALAISAMFRFASLPMIERRMLERRPHYAELQGEIPLLIPRPRR